MQCCNDRYTVLVLSSTLVLWLLVGVVPMFIRCVQTETPCTRWGPHGASFAYPLHATAYQMLFVAMALSFCIRRVRFATIHTCAPLGLAFGAKYAVTHLALQHTPSSVWALLHTANIIFIVIFSRLLLEEKFHNRIEVMAFFGVVMGTIISTTQQVQHVGALPIVLTLLDSALSGGVVPLLRRAMLEADCGPLQVTCIQMFIGVLLVFPLALVVEGPQFPQNAQQFYTLVISAMLVLTYHANLALLCSLITSAIVVGILESMKRLPAYAVVVLLQGSGHMNSTAWVGAALILAAATVFRLARTAALAKQQAKSQRVSYITVSPFPASSPEKLNFEKSQPQNYASITAKATTTLHFQPMDCESV